MLYFIVKKTNLFHLLRQENKSDRVDDEEVAHKLKCMWRKSEM